MNNSERKPMRVPPIFVLLSLNLMACKRPVEPRAQLIDINPNIQQEVEAKIEAPQFGSGEDDYDILIYDNLMLVDYFEHDSLLVSTRDTGQTHIFKSFFYEKDDTLSIDGFYGLFGGFGFSIKIKNDQATVYHLLAADEFPTFSRTEKSSLLLRMEVPCTNTSLTLSRMPVLSPGEVIYGVVTFDSDSYYQSGPVVDEQEMEPRTKMRMNMKVYFKARYMPIE